MIEIKNPYKKEALIEALEDAESGIRKYFASLPVEVFFRKPSNKWSAAENLVHLIKSVKRVSIGLKLPRLFIGLKFGKSERNSRMYPQIRETYLNKLVEGAKTPARFLPDDHRQTSDLDAAKEHILKKWDDVHQRFLRGLKHWKEEDLDKYLLPHPIMGSLTVREMVMFTIYHNVHHLTNVEKSLGESEVSKPA